MCWLLESSSDSRCVKWNTKTYSKIWKLEWKYKKNIIEKCSLRLHDKSQCNKPIIVIPCTYLLQLLHWMSRSWICLFYPDRCLYQLTNQNPNYMQMYVIVHWVIKSCYQLFLCWIRNKPPISVLSNHELGMHDIQWQ